MPVIDVCIILIYIYADEWFAVIWKITLYSMCDVIVGIDNKLR